MHGYKKANGFTLTEILIVIAIIGLLMVVVLPTYQEHTLKTNRSDAYSALNEIMQAQERFNADNGTYTTNLVDLGYADPQISERGRYSISGAVCAGTPIARCVLLSAAAIGAQASDLNDGAGNNIDITLNSRGEKAGW